ncbi:HEAT repeat domain-containing protein [Gemmata sp. JC717]|uniref:HEAT repeat domain-containing protein n=1 Tax=Gemmata algarum TaxID=2975278 RepID=UPI0021BB2CE3|nr:HEAT repeat domain-containing protein [Gemmata algarum]MDY3557211.1 HEAT repeat domain-containing protein [Gemmata algarum]
MIATAARLTVLFAGLLAVPGPTAHGATPREIDRAIQAGTAALKARYDKGGPAIGAQDTTLGAACLAGLALLEAGTPVNDPAVKSIANTVRTHAYTQNRTYYVALSLMFLDRFGDSNDVPLIQMLAVRLLVGQTAGGGWTYECCPSIPQTDVDWLKANLKANQLVAGAAGKPPKLHTDAERYGQALTAAKAQANGAGMTDDNSNTQFAVIAMWMARKHGVPVDTALDLIEKRFIASQDGRTGNWAYSGGVAASGMGVGSPSMYCAGLLGMATGVARREERRLKAEVPPPKKEPAKSDKLDDPFYNPPTPKEPAPKKAPARPADERDAVVQRAFAGLGLTIADQIRTGKGLLFAGEGGGHGIGDLYFLWSLERVGVVYGQEKIGGFDWYDIGSTALVRSQNRDGTWTVGGSYGTEVNTPFAVLFLCRSNLARDLSSKVQKDPTSTEMRAGVPKPIDVVPTRTSTAVPAPTIDLPNPTGDEAITLASKILKASGSDWAKLLAETRDTKGTTQTRALVLAATHSAGDRKAAAREALTERLCRMNAATLRTMLKANEPELRRSAALACAMKDDKDHIPDLIAAITDADDAVTRAAKAGLKSLTGKDFGPPAVPTAEQKTAAATAWREWYVKEKK